MSSVTYLIDKTLGRYRILEHLGHGGMSEVYKGQQTQLDRAVAVKVLHPFLADDEGFVVRFRREARIVATLRHPNIVQVYDFDYNEALDIYYMVMEYIDGPTLKDMIIEGRLPPERSVYIGAAIADALDYAHARAMIHRDIKPANIMFIDDEEPVLTDFGIAKMMNLTGLTASGAMVGTPAYMAPEVGIGESGTAQSDIYSLGVVIYQMLTGNLPFDSETPMGMVMQHINDDPPPLSTFVDDIPAELETVIMRTLAKEPADRYGRGSALASALRASIGERASVSMTQVPAAASSDEEPEEMEVAEIPRQAEAPYQAQAKGEEGRVETEGGLPMEGAEPAEDVEASETRGEAEDRSAYVEESAQPPLGLAGRVSRGIAGLLISSMILFAVWFSGGLELPPPLTGLMPHAVDSASPDATVPPSVTPPVETTPTPARTATLPAVALGPTSTPRSIPTPTPSPDCDPRVKVHDVRMVPDEVVPPAADLVTYITLRNPGTCAWPSDLALSLASGEAWGAPVTATIGAIPPGDSVQVVLPMRAPDALGIYTSTWQALTSQGPAIGGDVVVALSVEDIAAFTPTPENALTPATSTAEPLTLETPELLSWTVDLALNRWTGTVKMRAAGGNGEYRFYRDEVREDTRIADGILSFVWTRCEPRPLALWVLSGSETLYWQGEIAYPAPESCP